MGNAVSSPLAFGMQKLGENRLPELEGTTQLPILDKPASIHYDKWGFPHVYCETNKDLFRIQGFLIAQHRGFQLEMTKRVMNGTLSEIIGNPGKPVDVFSRTCGFYKLGKDDWNILLKNKDKNKDTIDMIQCYIQGINAWYGNNKYKKPIEFAQLLLNCEPQFWEPIDVCIVLRILGFKMSMGYQAKILNTMMTQIVGHEYASQFIWYSNDIKECNNDEFYNSVRDIYGLMDDTHLPQTRFINNSDIKSDYDVNMDIKLDNNDGSNAWVINGNLTNTGKPILCGDPHLTLQQPNTFYYIHMDSNEGIKLTGVCIAGLPGIVIGHNSDCAFTITLGLCNTSDIYVERFKDKNSNEYEMDGEFIKAEVRKEVIKIKGSNDYVLNVMETVHGPVLLPTDYDVGVESGPYSHLINTELEEKELKNDTEYDLRYSICATFLKPGTGYMDLFIDYLRATNAKALKAILRQMSWPNLNWVFADNKGNVGWTTNGLIPIHDDIKTYDPTLVLPGWMSKYTWNKYIDIELLPESFNPSNGFVISCNNSMVNENKYPYFLGCFFCVGYRAQRANDMLNDMINKDIKMDIDYMKSMQKDTLDLSAKEMIQDVLNHVNFDEKIDAACIEYDTNGEDIALKGLRNNKIDYNSKENKDKIKMAVDYLKAWDFKADTDKIGPSIYAAFIYCVVRRIIVGGMYKAKKNMNKNSKINIDTFTENLICRVYNKAFSGVHAKLYKYYGFVIKILKENSKNNFWVNNYIDRDNIVLICLIDGMDLLKYHNTNTLKWGEFHKIETVHPLSAKLGDKPWNLGPYPVSGNVHTLCVFKTKTTPVTETPLSSKGFGVSVWRGIYDTSNWDNSICILPGGMSGQIGSPYYGNTLQMFTNGEYIPMLWSKPSVIENTAHILHLNPSKIEENTNSCHIL